MTVPSKTLTELFGQKLGRSKHINSYKLTLEEIRKRLREGVATPDQVIPPMRVTKEDR